LGGKRRGGGGGTGGSVRGPVKHGVYQEMFLLGGSFHNYRYQQAKGSTGLADAKLKGWAGKK